MIFLLLAGASAVAQAPVPAVSAPTALAVKPAVAEVPAPTAPPKPTDPAAPQPAAGAPTKPADTPAKPADVPVKPIDAPAKPADAAAKPAEGAAEQGGPVVTVAAERPSNRIDRQVYDLKADASVTNSSAADALNNVPSVTVDPDGTVSLRGSTNVQILIDGKPSAMLQGEGRGAALNALPSHDIESIEVINNPGAQFGNEGGGGAILNLVMRRNRTPGGMAVLNANIGPAGRANTAFSGTYHEGLWGFQGGVNFRRDGRNSYGHTERDRIDALSGVHRASSQQSQSTGLNDSKGANGELSYKYGDKTVLAANMSLMRRTNNSQGLDTYLGTGADALPTGDYMRTSGRSGTGDNASWGLRMDSKGELPGEVFKLDLRVSSNDTTSNADFVNHYLRTATPLPDRRNRQDYRNGTDITDFTGDYERPVDQGIVKMGFKLAKNVNSLDTVYLDIDAVTGLEVTNASRSNRFKVEESNLAVYGSYQRRLNASWGVLGGLRVEHTGLDVHQISSGVDADNSYTNFIPSFFVNYTASETASIRLSYAHRIRRPNSNDLNPFVVYRDEFNVSAGNPKLHPSQSDSLELGYETKFGAIDTNLRAYYRKEKDIIAERSYFISDTVLLTTRDNGGTNRSGGLEFSLNGKLSPALSFNTSGNLAQTEQRVYDTGNVPVQRSSTALTLRARVNYQVTPQDSAQFSVNTQGRTLTGQGYRDPVATANLSLRHTVTPQLALVMNVTDLFDSNKTATHIDRALLRETSERRYDGRIIYIGLTYRMGGVTSGPGRQPGNRGEGRTNPQQGGERQIRRTGQEPGAQ
jgi:outer membrane receptor protein involved in Fe transport